jgi:hypothetical protein
MEMRAVAVSNSAYQVEKVTVTNQLNLKQFRDALADKTELDKSLIVKSTSGKD